MKRILLAALITGTACKDDGTSTSSPTSLSLDPTTPVTVPTTTPEPEPTCGPVELCTRTIDGCSYAMQLDECTSWYEGPYNCADMPAYIECNCDCVEEDTCDDYFTCGELCFQQLC